MTAHLLPVGVFVCLLRETLESDPFYADLWLEGEISDLSRSKSGHTYFSLRDADGVLKCVLFRKQGLRQLQPPKFGDQVVVHGGISIYPASGSMQLIVDLIRPAGMGAASLELEYLRQRLEAEGLFDPYRKRALPAWPDRIGVVTSPHGAAWHDIQTVIGRRFPFAELILSPAQVQGVGSPASIVAAIEALQAEAHIDVLILARGGGAMDDLSAFNDEQVVRAVFASRAPVVAGIGHATDSTLAEDAADAAAATPSAAAEICVPSVSELLQQLQSLNARLTWSMSSCQSTAAAQLRDSTDRLRARNPRSTLSEKRIALQDSRSRLDLAIDHCLTFAAHRHSRTDAVLHSLDPAAVLRRGYAALIDPADNQAIFSVVQLNEGSPVSIVLGDGTVRGTIDRVHEGSPLRGAS